MDLSTRAINARLATRLTKLEILSLSLLVLLASALSLAHSPGDFNNYLKAAHGDFSGFYYAYWFYPVVKMLSLLPFQVAYFWFQLANIAGLFFASRVFGGKPALILLSFQAYYILLFGQITGVIAGALALALWGFANKRPMIAGLGLLAACTKPQLGIPAALALWALYGGSRQMRLQALLPPAVILLASLIAYPLWPLRIVETILVYPPNDSGSVSLWRWAGPLALALWLPVFTIPMSKESRLVAVFAAMPLALPYFQQTDLLLLFALPVGWLPAVGLFGYLYKPLGWGVLPWLAIIPAVVYVNSISARQFSRALENPRLSINPRNKAANRKRQHL